MKNTIFWIVLPALWLFQTTAMAQVNAVFGNPLTNNVLEQSNAFQAELGRLENNFATPYMGTTLERATGGRAAYSPNGPPLEAVGPFEFYPHLLYKVSYGNALPAGPNTNSTTFVNEFAPGLFIKMGNVWTLDYTPSAYFYSNPVFHDHVDEEVFLNGNTTNGNWILSLSQRYNQTSEPLLETGTQPELDLYATGLGATWQMGAKTSLELTGQQNFRFLTGANLASLYEWKTVDWFNYQFQPQLSAAIGLGAGYDELSLSSSMPFEQYLGRVVFKPGTRLALSMVAGAEDRQFINSNTPSLLNPIFQALALYQITDGTLLSCSASRQVVPSLYQGDVNVITTVLAGVRQHIIGNVELEVQGDYSSEPFTDIGLVSIPTALGYRQVEPLTTTRTDTRESLNVRLSTTYRSRLTLALFCMFLENHSSNTGAPTSQQGYSYSGVQGGLELEYRY